MTQFPAVRERRLDWFTSARTFVRLPSDPKKRINSMSKASRKDSQALFSDILNRWRDNSELQDRKAREKTMVLTKKKKEKLNEEARIKAILRAARYATVSAGFIEISSGALFAPLFVDRYMLPVDRLSRSFNLRAALFTMITAELWNDLYLETCYNLEKHIQAEKSSSTRRVRHIRSSNKRQRTLRSWGNYRVITQSEFWRLIATIIHCARTPHSSISSLYSSDNAPDVVAKLLPEKLFTLARPALQIDDLESFCRTLNVIWCSKMIASGIFVIDESLWKFICKTKGTKKYQVVRTIPRKPAGTGLLSYELVGFSGRINLPYTYCVCPVTDKYNPTASQAAFFLMDAWNENKPEGSPADPLAIMDSAFSSEAALQGFEARGWKYCVSVNSQNHPQLCNALASGLHQFEYRIFAHKSGERISPPIRLNLHPPTNRRRGEREKAPRSSLSMPRMHIE